MDVYTMVSICRRARHCMAGSKLLSSVFSFPNEAQTRLENLGNMPWARLLTTQHAQNFPRFKVARSPGQVLIIDRINVHTGALDVTAFAQDLCFSSLAVISQLFRGFTAYS